MDGQTNSTDCLYGETANDLRRYVRSQLKGIKSGQDIDVDDVVQETYLRVWSSRNRGGIDNAKGYLFRTAKNLIIDIGRRRQTQPVENEANFPNGRGSAGVCVVKLTPERYVSAREDLEIVMQAIDNLPENCRRAFCLQRATGKKYADIALELDMSESMVQKHMARALLALHKVLPE